MKIDTLAAIYTIHECGRVETETRRKITIVGKNMEFTGNFKVSLEKPRRLKTYVNSRGYEATCLNRYTKMVHRLVAEAFVSNPENKPYVNHKNGNKLDNRAVNLEWCTHKENMHHAYTTGLVTETGKQQSLKALLENNPFNRLPNEAILDIRTNFKKRCSIYGAQAFAKKYNVSTTTISYVVNKRKHYANY